MKKGILLFCLSLLLVGCQKKDDDVTPKELVDTRPMYESNAKPRKLELRQENYTNLTNEIVHYCWAKESVDECPAELNDKQKEKLIDIREQVSPIGHPIELYFETYYLSPESHLPLPDSSELYLYKDGSYTSVEITDNKFSLPEEEGLYTYIYKTIYDGENKGVTFYAFKVRARYLEIEEEN